MTTHNGRLGWAMFVGLLAVACVAPTDVLAQRARSTFRLNYAAPRNDEVVRRAFREVVQQPSQSVVRILSDNRSVALGVVVDPAGYVLTKSSQLRGVIECHLFDNRRLTAEIVSTDTEYDLAMLKVNLGNQPVAAIRWHTAEQPELGSWLATPGLGALPVSVGVVSAQTRQISAGRGLLGILMGPGERGPSVDQVMPGSGAELAGLRVSDIILQVNDREVVSPDSLQSAIGHFKPGDRVSLVIQRGEQQLTLHAILRTLSQIQSHGESTVSVDGPISDRATGFPLVMQHDSVLDPSDCGGVVVDLDGRAVGVNIARADRVSTYAIPASALVPLIERLKGGKLVSTAR